MLQQSSNLTHTIGPDPTQGPPTSNSDRRLEYAELSQSQLVQLVDKWLRIRTQNDDVLY